MYGHGFDSGALSWSALGSIMGILWSLLGRRFRKLQDTCGQAQVYRRPALIGGGRRPRGAYKLWRIYVGLPQFQFRISGRSWPFLSMYCLCSMSLSLSCCFT
jgi:hypothetical protein